MKGLVRSVSRRRFLGGAGSAAVASVVSPGRPRAAGEPIRIGVIGDFSGPYVDNIGLPFVRAAQMAVEDFGKTVLDRPIEIVFADDATKADVSLQIARRWVDTENVQAIICGSTSAIAVGLNNLTNERKRVLILAGTGNSDLTGKLCTPTSFQFGFDTYSSPKAAVVAATKAGLDSWYIIGQDYAFGIQLETAARSFIAQAGGKVIGSARHPLNTPDFSSFVLQAISSGAKAIAMANAGTDMATLAKQAREFGIDNSKQILVPLAAYFPQIKALGPETAQGMLFNVYFYWDYDERTRAWSKRQMARADGKVPDVQQAASYSSVLHYLKAIKEAGTTDGPTVAAAMKKMRVNDALLTDTLVREDGQLMRPMYLAQAKKPSEVTNENDIMRIVQVVAPDEGMRSLKEGGCPLVKL